MKHIAVFASGTGTNAENLIRHFRKHPHCRVNLVLCNKPGAGVLDRAARLGVKSMVFTRQDLYETGRVLNLLKEHRVDFIVLAGFLWLIPQPVLEAFPGRIINIHPALLPAYGGKGMYGRRVHEAVINNRDKKSGVTVHLVNEEYDAGNILFQEECDVLPGDTPDTLAERVHQLEYEYYPRVVEDWISQQEA
ncbi:MAG TPA: phosphoribosylglycinamide formyltransferase [Bacteroidetes bacterium]|nr:phosphoribosylglycinamide formyltransferase [Bacteroidota bacterium]